MGERPRIWSGNGARQYMEDLYGDAARGAPDGPYQVNAKSISLNRSWAGKKMGASRIGWKPQSVGLV